MQCVVSIHPIIRDDVASKASQRDGEKLQDDRHTWAIVPWRMTHQGDSHNTS